MNSRRDDCKDALVAAVAIACRDGDSRRLERLNRWAARFEPRGPIEEDMVGDVIRYAERLEDTRLARDSWRLKHVEDSVKRAEDDVESLGRRLLFDPRGPALIYSSPRFSRSEPGSQETAAPAASDPAELVANIESTEFGCGWLLERWAELRANLAPGEIRGFSDNFRIVRLMGKEPRDAFENPEVAEVYLASHALDRRERNPFAELRNELRVDEMKGRLSRMQTSATAARTPRDKSEARLWLLGDRSDRLMTAAVRGRMTESDRGLWFEAGVSGSCVRLKPDLRWKPQAEA
jgi:hypothetical protein